MAFTLLVTRPSHQSEYLNSILRQAGFDIISFPTLSIQATPPSVYLKNLEQNIRNFDIALFVSRNAVDFAFKSLHPETLPASLKLGVIGQGTWQALKNHGVESSIIPAESYNSEGLLNSPGLHNVTGQRIAIFRGQQGRNLLGDTLLQRGASVEYIEVYRRTRPKYDGQHFDDLTTDHFPDLAIFTSSEGLTNCLSLLTEKQSQALRSIPWLLISERMRETSRNLRHNAEIIIAHAASDEGILQALLAWRKSKV